MKRLIFTLFFLIVSANAFSLNQSFLKYSPISYFTAEDTKIMKQTMINTLNNASDGSRVTWQNPKKTGTNGYFIPSHTTTENGNKCRNLTIFNEAHHVKGKSTYKLCKVKNNWVVAQ